MRVILAEDDLLLREGLASLLERSGFDVVGQAGDGAQLLAMVREQQARPGGDRYSDAAGPNHRRARRGPDHSRRVPDTGPIVVLSAHVDVEHAMELLSGGHASGICSRAG